ncbi:MAG TPA: HlyD family type I secretion periplasmic adaptor subunit [Candidatus Omnitrophota bacterium]|nr:HlyD family type I secretion periplasmic adaptor subunit [Candidatus Omnitrophota bacterium]
MSKSVSTAADAALGRAGDFRALLRRWQRRLEAPRTFLVAVLALLLLLLLWAGLAVVDKIVRVEGRIVPAGRAQQIQHLEGGIVAAITTAEGASVRKGELLLTIDATTAGANLSETEVKLTGQRIRAARLEAEARGLDTLVIPPALDGPQAEGERRLFATRRQKLEQELRVLDEQGRQRAAELSEVENRRQRLAGELATARQRSAILDGLAARNAASRLEILDAVSREQRLATEMGDAEATLPKIRAAMAELRARAEDIRLRARSEAQEDLVAARVEIDRLEQILTAQTDRVTRTDVRAPADGVVNRITVNTVGGVIKPGDVIVELTPTAGEVLIEARARPSDRGDLRPGLDAKVRVSAYDTGQLGTLSGRVVEVSADTVQDGRQDPYYRVGIRIDALPESYAGKLLAPGMTVTGDVVTGERTVLSHLTSPFSRFASNVFRDAR